MNNSKHTFFTGLAIGLAAPLIVFYFFSILGLHLDPLPAYQQLEEKGLLLKVITISVVVGNALAFFVFNRKNQWQKAKGVVGATIIYALFMVSKMI